MPWAFIVTVACAMHPLQFPCLLSQSWKIIKMTLKRNSLAFWVHRLLWTFGYHSLKTFPINTSSAQISSVFHLSPFSHLRFQSTWESQHCHNHKAHHIRITKKVAWNWLWNNSHKACKMLLTSHGCDTMPQNVIHLRFLLGQRMALL